MSIFAPHVMSILKYFTRKSVDSLPHPEGTLSSIIPPIAINSPNSEVRKVIG